MQTRICWSRLSHGTANWGMNSCRRNSRTFRNLFKQLFLFVEEGHRRPGQRLKCIFQCSHLKFIHRLDSTMANQLTTICSMYCIIWRYEEEVIFSLSSPWTNGWKVYFSWWNYKHHKTCWVDRLIEKYIVRALDRRLPLLIFSHRQLALVYEIESFPLTSESGSGHGHRYFVSLEYSWAGPTNIAAWLSRNLQSTTKIIFFIFQNTNKPANQQNVLKG